MLVLTPEERQEPDRLLQRLKQSPWQLLFDTSAFSKSNVRQVMVRVHADAENTPYNSPALLRELLVLLPHRVELALRHQISHGAG